MENTTNSNPEAVSDTSASSHHSSSRHSSSHNSSSHHSSSHHSSSHHSSSHHSSSHHSSSQHSSSKQSSHHSKHRKRRKKKNKFRVYDKWRKICSFALFVSIAALSAFAAMEITVLNETRIVSAFTGTEYINALYDDVQDYSRDLCIKCSIPENSVDDALAYSSISEIQKAYTLGNLVLDEMYSESTYADLIEKMNSDIVDSINASIEKNNIVVDEAQVTSGAQTIADSITDYFKGRVEFKYTSFVQSVLNVSNTVKTVGIVLFSILSLAFFLLTISLTDKKYHAMRSIAFSFFAAAGLNLLLVCFVGIIGIFKDLVIYPEYFCQTVMRYINSCVSTFLLEGLLLFIVGLSISALTWRLKRDKD